MFRLQKLCPWGFSIYSEVRTQFMETDCIIFGTFENTTYSNWHHWGNFSRRCISRNDCFLRTNDGKFCAVVHLWWNGRPGQLQDTLWWHTRWSRYYTCVFAGNFRSIFFKFLFLFPNGFRKFLFLISPKISVKRHRVKKGIALKKGHILKKIMQTLPFVIFSINTILH